MRGSEWGAAAIRALWGGGGADWCCCMPRGARTAAAGLLFDAAGVAGGECLARAGWSVAAAIIGECWCDCAGQVERPLFGGDSQVCFKILLLHGAMKQCWMGVFKQAHTLSAPAPAQQRACTSSVPHPGR